MYDISGIQKFIFATGKLKEQMGGSNIIHRIMYDSLPELLGKRDKEEWRKEKYKFDVFSGNIKGNIVYIGGGNAMALYEDEHTMQNINREMQKQVYKLSAGNIRLCYSFVEIDSLDIKGKKYGEVYDELMAKMAIFKREHTAVSTVRGFSINAKDVNTFEPIIINFIKGREIVSAASTFQKYINRERDMGRFNKYKFLNQFDEYFKLKDGKSFLAVIHIDGNSMGKKIQKFIKSMDNNPRNTIRNSLEHMKALSIEIDTIYENALVETLDKIFCNEITQQMTIPFRLVIRDGDDLTAVIDAKKAFEFVEVYMEKLKEQLDKNEEKYPEIIFGDMEVSAGAGITFIHNKFPFDTAYDYAEQLCKLAKAKLRERSECGLVPEDTSCMDFQIIRSGMSSDIAKFRKKEYAFSDSGIEYNLSIRPYLFLDDDTIQDSYGNFKKIINNMISGDIARSKLKELRNSYLLGKDDVQNCYRLILSRKKGGIMGDGDKNVFSNENIAMYFDALDVLDFMEGEND